MKYLLYVNVRRSRARLHRDYCWFVKLRGGIDKHDAGFWEEYTSRETAMAALDKLTELRYETARCGFCVP